MTNLSLFYDYITAYAGRDIDRIGEMFDDEIHLRDWTISVRGKAAAINETAKNFESSKTIVIDVLQVYKGKDTVAGELRVVVNHDIELFVVDIIQFTEARKIKAIRAYQGRPSE